MKRVTKDTSLSAPTDIHKLHSDLPFLPECVKIDKYGRVMSNLYNKPFFVHMKALEQAINHRFELQKVHWVIEFNQEAWLKAYIDLTRELRTLAKNDFDKDLFGLMKNLVFGNNMESGRNYRDIKLLTTIKISCFVSGSNYRTATVSQKVLWQ